jgi:hypothetical protein
MFPEASGVGHHADTPVFLLAKARVPDVISFP